MLVSVVVAVIGQIEIELAYRVVSDTAYAAYFDEVAGFERRYAEIVTVDGLFYADDAVGEISPRKNLAVDRIGTLYLGRVERRGIGHGIGFGSPCSASEGGFVGIVISHAVNVEVVVQVGIGETAPGCPFFIVIVDESEVPAAEFVDTVGVGSVPPACGL